MKKIISVLGLGLALTFGGAALAQGDRGFERGHGGAFSPGFGEGGVAHHIMKRVFSKLDLSEEQEASVKALREAAHESLAANQGDRKAFGDQLQALIQTESLDEEAFRTLVSSQQAQALEMRLIHAKMRNGIWNVLSDSQQQQLLEMMAKRGFRGNH